jgi:hypothetical protein
MAINETLAGGVGGALVPVERDIGVRKECYGMCCLPVAVLQFVTVGPLVAFFAVTEGVVPRNLWMGK